MKDKKIYLVDTNSYIRVAKSSDTILGDHLNFQLRLISEIAEECNRSSRLHQISPWLHEPPFPQTRKRWTIKLLPADQAKIRRVRSELRGPLEDFLDDFADKKRARNDFRPVLSPPDLAVFCTAEALGFGIVTDEQPLTAACKEFDVPCISTLELLKMLLDQGRMTKASIDAMVRLWQWEKDTPPAWRTHYRRLFGNPIPEFTLDS